ncbi:septum formation inhibitor MinC (plasmid) [Paracoccus yeei]|uniref:septum site-determining protein MinC n=1 Tax=Paracoccus yeei TaxID=147645 RepID=UPI0028D155CC|nr:septum site-determining protein MinC [Paracoccus yeei]
MQAQGPRENAASRVATVRPLQIRGRFFTAIALQPAGPVDDRFLEALDAKLRETPAFFENAPLVIDLEQSHGLDDPRELMLLAQELRARKLSVFGIQHGTAQQVAAAASAGLIALPGGRSVPVEQVAARAESRGRKAGQGGRDAPGEAPAPAPAKMITQPVRSGQTVLAEQGDLVIVGPVSSGAEVIAAGNIHIYGRLRGRALAGVMGDTTARIFCHALDAELLAIAGLYLTSENLAADVPRHYVQAFLDGESLRVEALK